MLKNYLRLAWRHLLKSKMYSLINISGLAIGMAVALLIGLWIWDELSFNHYYDNHGRLALVYDTQTWNGKASTDREVDIPLAHLLKTGYANDFKKVALISASESGHLLVAGDKKLTSTGIYMEPRLPEMLTLKMIDGSRDGLTDPSSIMLTASLAKALFGDANPIGKAVRIDKDRQAKVTGVYEDLPRNTEYQYVKFLLPWKTFEGTHTWVQNAGTTQWGFHFGRIIAQLNDGIDIDKLNQKIKDLPKNYVKVGKEEIYLLSMDKLHLYNEFRDGKVIGGPIRFVWLFGIIGVFVLLLACINFMNLSTARSEQRAKEVGIRKAIGSLRGQLVAQFLSESLLLATLSLMLALFLVYSTLPFFNSMLANKELTLPWQSPIFWLLIIGFTLFTGLIAGSYPAFYLSGFSPLKVLKGAFRAGPGASLPRKVLVTVQFTVSITLIIGTIIVFRQIQFAKNRPVGYSQEGLVMINTDHSPGLADHPDVLKNELLQTGAVENVAASTAAITDTYVSQTGFDWNGRDPNAHQLFRTVGVTNEYGSTVHWQIKEGRDFYKGVSDSMGFILNEAAIKLTGLKDPIGQIIRSGSGNHPIIGVVKDMLTESPYSPAAPTIFTLYGGSYIYLRINPEIPMHAALDKITPVFKRYDPERPLNYKFVDDQYAFKFAAEERIGHLATFFAIFAIFISCLGLFGLASFVAEQRTKEIGIRKVLGASVFNLWSLLSREFVALVIISFFIAAPIAWYYLDAWLQKYEYHASISWWIFAAAGFGALLITLLTVSAQSIKAALMNPAKSLKTEG